MNIIDFLNKYYSEQDQAPYFFRNGPPYDDSERLQKMGAIGSMSWTENGKVVTEYVYPEDAPPR